MKRILVVEDNEMNRDLLVQLLEDDYAILCATDGEEAVSVARKEHPDLILMDLSLPLMDGWEAARQIKADAALAAIPVIALTAHAMAGDREKALAAGCDGFLTKPLDEDLLFDVLTSHLGEP